MLLIGSVLKHKLVCLRLGKGLAPDRCIDFLDQLPLCRRVPPDHKFMPTASPGQITAFQLGSGRQCRYRDLNAIGTKKDTANTSAIEIANDMTTSERKDLRNKKANTKMFHT